MSELRALSLCGGQAGTTFDLSVSTGDRLDEVETLYFSDPRITADAKTLDPLPFVDENRPHDGHFTVTIPDDTPPGRYEVRAGGRHGVSNPRAFLVTPLIHKTVAVSHDSKAPAALPLSTVLHAAATPANVDYFEFSVDVEQSVRIEIVAQRIDSRMIGQLKLLDAGGRVIAATRGADHVDPVLTLDRLAPGSYVLSVHDFLFRGGEEFHYMLAAQPSSTCIELVCSGDDGGRLPIHWLPRAFTLAGPDSTDVSDAGDHAATLEVPCDFTGTFALDHSPSVFEFAAEQEEPLAINIESHRRVEPTDVRMIVRRIEDEVPGPPMLNRDDSQRIGDGAIDLRSNDPVALFTAPVKGRYQLLLRDLDRGVVLSKRQKYRLRISTPNPGFDLVAYRVYPHSDAKQSRPLASKLFRGGAEAIRVFAVRRDGWSGSIRLTAENLPSGVSCSETIIAPNQNQAQLTLVASEDAQESVSTISVWGRSDDGRIRQRAVPVTIVWPRGGGRDFVRSRMTTGLCVAVSQRDLSPLFATLGDGSMIDVKKGETLSLPIKLTRRDGGTGAPCILRPRDLPAKVEGGEVTIAADASEANYDIKVTSDATPGIYSIWLQAEAKIKLKPNPQALERAEEYRAHLQSLHDDPAQAPNLGAIQSAIVAADQRVEAARAVAKEQDLTVFIPTTNATIRIIEP